jgi:hypothetical protein
MTQHTTRYNCYILNNYMLNMFINSQQTCNHQNAARCHHQKRRRDTPVARVPSMPRAAVAMPYMPARELPEQGNMEVHQTKALSPFLTWQSTGQAIAVQFMHVQSAPAAAIDPGQSV